jgi:dCTP deaminase
MILTGPEIIRQHGLGAIRIDPFNLDQVNPNSYNFRLGRTVKVYKNDVLDPKIRQTTVSIEIPDEGLVLDSARIYLAHTEEVMGSDRFVPIIHGRSSTARMGLFVHITADLIDIGSYNQWTLQLHAVQPVRIFRGMLIGQVTFWCVQGEISLYAGRYQGAMGPRESESYRDFADPEAEAL